MTTYLCDANKEVEDREAPQQLASTFMIGRWTFHSYKKSHDDQTLIFHLHEGFQLRRGDETSKVEMNLRKHNPREFLFSPDNSQVAFWGPIEKNEPWKRIALMQLSSISNPKHKIIYTPPPNHHPFGMEWSPTGKHLYVVEYMKEMIGKKDGLVYSILSRLALNGKKTELFRTLGKIDFFMPPVSRFENGQGPTGAPYRLVLGCENGLYLVDPKNGKNQRLSKIPAMGLHNLEWNPDPKKNQLLLFFRNPVVAPDGRRFQGLYKGDIDKMDAALKSLPSGGTLDEKEFIEQLHQQRNIHTLWFSPKGTYMTWASEDAIFFRRPEDPTEKTAVIEILDEDNNPRKLKGVSWNHEENKLVFSADSQVWIYDLDPEEDKDKDQQDEMEKMGRMDRQGNQASKDQQVTTDQRDETEQLEKMEQGFPNRFHKRFGHSSKGAGFGHRNLRQGRLGIG